MGAPATMSNNTLNFDALRKSPNIVSAPRNNVDVDAALGLAPSQYDGLQKVGDTGYFYGNNKMYEPYTPTPTTMVGNPVEIMMGRVPSTAYPDARYGVYAPQQPQFETITVGDQTFRTIDQDVTGFSKSKIDDSNIYEYTPSMAYVYANAVRPAPTLTPNVTSFLSPPTMPSNFSNFGAGRFLNTGNLLGFNFGTPSGQTAGGQTTA